MTRYISVQYGRDGDYGGREYTYINGLPGDGDVNVGDIVIAPTAKGDNTARVSHVDVPESKIGDRVLPFLKIIEHFAPAPDTPEDEQTTAEPIIGTIEDL